MKKPVNHYTDEFKLEIVQEYLTTDCSHKDLYTKYNIRGGSAITEWMRKFGLSLPSIQKGHIPSDMPKPLKKPIDSSELEARIQRLERELEREKFRTLALNTLIDVAERDLKISIRKKPGAKQ